MAISSSLHVMRQPLRHVGRITADDKPRLPQLLKRRTWGRHLSAARTLAIVKRAIRLNPWHRRRHLHRAAEGGETPHVHHGIPALGNGLLIGLGHMDVARPNAALRASVPAKALLRDCLIVFEGVLED